LKKRPETIFSGRFSLPVLGSLSYLDQIPRVDIANRDCEKQAYRNWNDDRCMLY
jgi:hypothetical protein